MSKKYDYDLIIIGSGAGGSVGAHYATAMNKKVALFEMGDIGGECPNWACVPTKALLHSAEVYNTAKNASDYGIKISDVKFDYAKVKQWKDLVVSRTGAAHGAESFREDHIHLIREKATFVSGHIVEAGGQKYSASKFLIATGSDVFIPPIEGLKETGYITFHQAVDFTKLPKSIFILGGGPIGCEFSQVFASFGCQVTLADTLPKLIAKEDFEVSDLVQALFEEKGIKVLTNIKVTKVEKHGALKRVHVQHGQHTETVDVEEILVATGKRANLNFNPEAAGLKVKDGRLEVNSWLQTNVPHIFAAGDIVGPYLFTHTGYYQSYIAVNNMFTHSPIKPDYSVVPRCVFTNPEVASVGLSETQAKVSQMKIKVGMAAISMLGRANTSNDFNGFVKVITDKNEVIIGGAIVAPHAGEMIHEIALAIRMKVKAGIIADMLHAYPTFSEGIKIACSNLENR